MRGLPWKVGDRLFVIAAPAGDDNAVEMSPEGDVVIGSVNVPDATTVQVVDVRSSERTDVIVIDGPLAGRRFRILGASYLRDRDN
jgi:hypothetical protein